MAPDKPSVLTPRPIIDLNSFGASTGRKWICGGSDKRHGDSGQSVSRLRWRKAPRDAEYAELSPEEVRECWAEVRRQVLDQGFDLATHLDPPACADCREAAAPALATTSGYCRLHKAGTAGTTKFLGEVQALRQGAHERTRGCDEWHRA